MIPATLLNRRRKLGYQLLRDVQATTLTPKQYCEKWLPLIHGINLSEHGARKLAIEELHKATGIAKATIKNWGPDFERAPQTVHRTLTYADQIQSSSELWSGIIAASDLDY